MDQLQHDDDHVYLKNLQALYGRLEFSEWPTFDLLLNTCDRLRLAQPENESAQEWRSKCL